jgi:hypothetical protein
VLAPPLARLQAGLLGAAVGEVLLDVDSLAAAVLAHAPAAVLPHGSAAAHPGARLDAVLPP